MSVGVSLTESSSYDGQEEIGNFIKNLQLAKAEKFSTVNIEAFLGGTMRDRGYVGKFG